MFGSQEKSKPKVYTASVRQNSVISHSLNYLIGLIRNSKILLIQIISIRPLGFVSPRLHQNQNGFITMIVMILAILIFMIGFVFMRVLKANQ